MSISYRVGAGRGWGFWDQLPLELRPLPLHLKKSVTFLWNLFWNQLYAFYYFLWGFWFLGGASASPDPPIKSAWRPPNMDMYSGCYIKNMDIYIYIYSGCYIQNMDIFIFDFVNLGTNVANESIRILTLDIPSRIYIQTLVIWVPMLQMNRCPQQFKSPI
jgi:hypothetical protein